MQIGALHNNIAYIYEARAKTHEDLAHVLRRYETAHRIFRACLGQNTLSADAASVYYNMATIKRTLGQKLEAKDMFLECATVYESLYGKEHAETLDARQQATSCDEPV